MKRFLSIILLVTLLLMSLSCQKEKTSTEIFSIGAKLTEEEFYSDPDLILRATVEKVADEYFTNPEGTKIAEYGEPCVNAHITVYTLKIAEIYKGTWDSETIDLKIFNGKGLSPELYLYGEDEETVLEEEVEKFLLEVGEEYIFGIVPFSEIMKQRYDEKEGYCLKYGDVWCFKQNEEGLYENFDTEGEYRVLDMDTLKAGIATYN